MPPFVGQAVCPAVKSQQHSGRAYLDVHGREQSQGSTHAAGSCSMMQGWPVVFGGEYHVNSKQRDREQLERPAEAVTLLCPNRAATTMKPEGTMNCMWARLLLKCV